MSDTEQQNIYRVVTGEDSVHYYQALSLEDAKEEHWDLHDPRGTDDPYVAIADVRVSTMAEMDHDMNHDNATCWCEHVFEE
jgi:hypothetical protein